jgi:CelD/BcsL family acetyltransferase involved in cellulose biosynthesis
MHVLDLDHPAWLAFVSSCPAALPYHHPAWARLLADCYRYPAFALVQAGPDGGIRAGLPCLEVKAPWGGGRRWVSLPYTDVCPPLTAAGYAQPELVVELDTVRKDAGVAAVEIRDALHGPGAFSDGVTAWTHTLELDPDPQVVLRSFHRSQVQRNLARAERSGLVVAWGERRQALVDDFYRLHLLTRQRLGVPVQPGRFFRLLWERIIEPGLGRVLVAYASGTPVAAAVFLTWNGTMVYKYGASDAAHWSRRPNHLLFWTAIRWACENGYRRFDFGRTDQASASLREFKRYWGTREQELVYSVIADAEPAAARGRLSAALGAVIRRSPLLVCRLSGELFYKYAA